MAPGTQLFDRPIFIIGCNRSGTTLMFNCLSRHPDLWSYYEESKHVYHSVFPVHPEHGERITASQSAGAERAVLEGLYADAHNKEYFKSYPLLSLIPRRAVQRPMRILYKRPPIRLVEKTPSNCLRIPFLNDLFPDARFIFLIRRAEDTISSLMEGWKNWDGTGSASWRFKEWHYVVPPGWQEWTERRLEEICAFQWVESVRSAWTDLDRCCGDRVLLVRHEEALANPTGTYERIQEFCELAPSAYFRRQVDELQSSPFTHGGSAPGTDKWMQLHRREIESVRSMFTDLQRQFYD